MPSMMLRLMLGLVAATGLAGCGGGEFKDYNQSEKSPKPAAHDDHDHDHGPAPHGGHLVHLGDHEYHGEVVFDAKENKVTVYILEHEVTKALPIDEKEITLNLMIDKKAAPFTLKAVPLEGEPEGKSSRFELAGDPTISEHVKDAEDLEGALNVTIGGKPYTGKIEHDHDHEHGHDHHDDHGKEKEAGKTESKEPQAPEPK